MGGVKLFRFPEAHDPCLLLRTAEDEERQGLDETLHGERAYHS